MNDDNVGVIVWYVTRLIMDSSNASQSAGGSITSTHLL